MTDKDIEELACRIIEHLNLVDIKDVQLGEPVLSARDRILAIAEKHHFISQENNNADRL